jgi:glycosyltransferase involved in cell wall biosynthesis
MLVIGTPDAHEKPADFLLNQLGIQAQIIPEMGREISLKDDLVAYNKIKSIIKQFKPDIVHTHTSKPGAIGRWAAANCKVPVVVHTFHGHVFHSYFSPLKTRMYIEIERRLAQRSSKLIAISPIQKKELVETYRIAPENKVEVIPLGLDLDPFRTDNAAKRLSFRKEFGLADEEIVIGIIGRLAPIKNHRLFIDAVKFLQKASSRPVKAFIIGDGECRQELEYYCKNLHIGFSKPEAPDFDQPIIFTSWRTDIDTVNAGLDIIALTSLNEGTPVSIIEAQASAKPIVSTVCGGIRDVVMEGETALLSALDNPSLFFDNLLMLVENDDLREKMSARGTNYAFSRFGYHRLVHETDMLYRKLLYNGTR